MHRMAGSGPWRSFIGLQTKQVRDRVPNNSDLVMPKHAGCIYSIIFLLHTTNIIRESVTHERSNNLLFDFYMLLIVTFTQ